MDDSIIIVQVALLVVVLFPLALGVYGLLRERHIKLFGVETSAKVIAFKWGGSTKWRGSTEWRDSTVAPEVEYQTEAGVIHSKSCFAMSRRLYSFNVGDTIRIRYDREHVKRFRIVGSKLPTIMFSVVLLAGIIVLALAMFIPYLLIMK